MYRTSLRLHLLRRLSVCSALLAHLSLRICSTLRLCIRRLCLNPLMNRNLRLCRTLHICIRRNALLSALLNVRLRLYCLLRSLRLSLLLLL